MKVKLQYTVDMDEIPHEISRLLDKATSNIDSSIVALGNASEFSSLTETEKFCDAIKSAREQMIHADLLLGDCVAIATSYNVAKANSLIGELTAQEENIEVGE